MIENYIVTEGVYKGRVWDQGIARELADAEEYWREKLGDTITSSEPDEHSRKMGIALKGLIDSELKRLIAERAAKDISKEVDDIYNSLSSINTDEL